MQYLGDPLELAQMDVRVGSEEEFGVEMAEVAKLVEQAPGCSSFEIYRSNEVSSRFRLLVRWSSIDDHIKFRATDHVVKIRAVFARYVTDRVATEHLLRIYPRE